MRLSQAIYSFSVENKTGSASISKTNCCSIQADSEGEFVLKAFFGGVETAITLQVSEAQPVELIIDQVVAGPITVDSQSEVKAFLQFTDGTMQDKSNDVLWFYDVSSSGYSDAGMVFKDTDEKYYIRGLRQGEFAVIVQLGDLKSILPIQID